MLIYLYLFSLIVGGVLLGASILLGGHDDADVEGGGHLDVDGDLDVDVDGDLDVDGDADAHAGHHGHDTIGGHGSFEGFLLTFLSLRFWTFFLAFFGLTGIVVDGLDLAGSSLVALLLAVGMGGAVGVGAVSAIRALTASSSGHLVRTRDYIGKTARVIVPSRNGSLGKVRVDIQGSSVDLLAVGMEGEEIEGREEVLIVEMEGSKARVARLGLRGPDRS
ncbi:MAG: hypothetical protein ACFCGT_24350 [Sandaracinaceae bacterium]